MTFVAISVDLIEHEKFGKEIIIAFYYRKAIQPWIVMQVLAGALLLGGIVNYSKALIGVVTTNASFKRKAFDVAGAGKFAFYCVCYLCAL